MLDTTNRPRVFSVDTVKDGFFYYDLGFEEQQLIPNSQIIASSTQIPCDFPKQTPLNPTTSRSRETRSNSKWELLTKVRRVRGFLGFCNYYRQFIDGYSRIAEPLTRLTRKDLPFHWTLECQHAFEQLKDTLIKAPVLAKWTPDLEMAIECDSSGYAVGGTLMQKIKGLWHPVTYFSKKLNPAESNYPIHDKKILAIIRYIREWRTELIGQHFEVWSDHRNLAYFRKKQYLGKTNALGI